MRLLTFLLLIMFGSAHAVSINEIRIDQVGADDDEYFELLGSSGESLDDLSYIVIGDGSIGSGVIESVTDLSGHIIGSTGLFLVTESSFSLGNVAANIDNATLSFENSDNVTHLLVRGFTGAINDDLDLNNNGLLDSTPWTEIIDSIALIESLPADVVNGTEHVYSSNQVGPNGTFVPAHVFRCDAVFGIGTFNVDDAGSVDTPGVINICDDPDVGGGEPVIASIPEIQSELEASPFNGQVVETSGVVTAVFTGIDDNEQLRGFYLQDPVGDDNVGTSDGVFVFYPTVVVDVAVGDQISITAQVTEFFGLTELTSVSSIVVNSSGNSLPEPALVNLPEAFDGELEQYEGMLVEIGVEMTISQNFFLSRFGQMTLSSPDDAGNAGRLFQPTNQFVANTPEALALAEENSRRILILDDGQDISGFGDNPVPVPYIGLDPVSVIRSGDTVSNLVGVIDFGRINGNATPSRDYRIHPTQPPVFNASNPRSNVPESTNGEITVASFNVLNYFTTIDNGGSTCGPFASVGCRGADSSEELVRQEDKLVSAITAIDADIVGLIEVENNGFGAGSAIQNLVNAINLNIGTPVYQVLTLDEGPVPGVGGDAITVGFIYKPAAVDSVGVVAVLDTGAFSDDIDDGGFSRQPIAASFRDKSSREVFTVVVNHFKSKNPRSTPLDTPDGNEDQGDGQGAFNLRRTEAANDLTQWLATNPTGINDSDILVIGDLNAYAQEDPILAFESAGYVDLVKQFEGDSTYTFTFDGLAGSLDHALATPSLAVMVSGVTQWHTNTDEPPVIDYNTEFNPEGYYEVNSFRASDHDAVIIGLNFQLDSACYVVKATNGNVFTFCL